MITVEKLNDVYLHVTSTPDVEMELSEHFKFFIPNAKYMPSFKNGLFDGYLRLYSAYKKTLYVGLLPYLLEFAKGNDYPIDIKFETDLVNIDYKFVEYFASLLDIHSKNCKIEMRDYQIETVLQALQKKRLIVSSPTSCMDPNTLIDVQLDENGIHFLNAKNWGQN